MLLSCSSDDNVNSNPIPTGSDTVSLIFDNQEFSTKNDGTFYGNSFISPSYTGTTVMFYLMNVNFSLGITIGININIEEGKTYPLNAYNTSNGIGRFSFDTNNSQSIGGTTNNEIGGTITIVKLDYENRIIAATFEFDAAEDDGTVHTIRNGWFDLKF